MIRTRDLVLYLAVLFFIVLAAVHTGVSGRAVAGIETLFVTPTTEVTPSAYVPDAEDTLAARWQQLKARLAAGDGYLPDTPAVFTSVDQVVSDTAGASGTDSIGFLGERTPMWCGAPVASPAVQNWPRTVQLTIADGQRVVETMVEVAETVGSTTETRRSTEVVASSLPIRSIRSTFDSCLPDTLIGVTTNGTPLTNDAATQLTAVASTQPIGYTRDGFTIYGPVADPSVLDACGGVYVNGVYQYHIRVDEPFVIACYGGVPVAI